MAEAFQVRSPLLERRALAISGVAVHTTWPYTRRMLTIAEATEFSALWPDYWTPEEFGEFCAWLALNPEAGDVVPRSGGCRKVRWSVSGSGKRGGVRVIYFNRLDERKIWLITMYAKNERESIPAEEMAKSREKVHGKGKTERKGAAGARRKAKHHR
jgi:hypothetical protein